jgi:hypothetical protein
MHCANCRVVKYCSRKCQKLDWAPGHKKICLQLKHFDEYLTAGSASFAATLDKYAGKEGSTLPPIAKWWSEKKKLLKEEETICRSCGKISKPGAGLVMCDLCKKVGYCSKACQTDNWEGCHSLLCKAFRALDEKLEYEVFRLEREAACQNRQNSDKDIVDEAMKSGYAFSDAIIVDGYSSSIRNFCACCKANGPGVTLTACSGCGFVRYCSLECKDQNAKDHRYRCAYFACLLRLSAIHQQVLDLQSVEATKAQCSEILESLSGVCCTWDLQWSKSGSCFYCAGQPAAGQLLKRCPKCQVVKYCDQNCQKLDWEQSPGHKNHCTALKSCDEFLRTVIAVYSTAVDDHIRLAAKKVGSDVPSFRMVKWWYDRIKYMLRTVTACSHCGKSPGSDAALLACAGCHHVHYCCSACQDSHWETQHKLLCPMYRTLDQHLAFDIIKMAEADET